jgi:hypothetical protein
MVKPTTVSKRHPISMRTQKALLQTLKARAEAGDVPAIEALIRINVAARAAPAV